MNEIYIKLGFYKFLEKSLIRIYLFGNEIIIITDNMLYSSIFIINIIRRSLSPKFLKGIASFFHSKCYMGSYN